MEKIKFELYKGESYIPLIQLLKATNIVYSGSEAQQAVSDGLVSRNGEIELRKRAKIRAGEIITIGTYEIEVC